MLLTVSKRLEFSASRRLHVDDWSESENLSAFGPETNARHGSGRNYIAYFIFTGPVDPTTGMLINISEIKERAGKNVRLFGPATALHGHNYRCRLTFREEQFHGKEPLVRYDSIETCIRGLRTELDHHYLNEEVVGLKERPITTESLAGYIYERTNTMIPLHRVRLHERADFFAEACRNNTTFLGLQVPFHAAHRLHTAAFSETE